MLKVTVQKQFGLIRGAGTVFYLDDNDPDVAGLTRSKNCTVESVPPVTKPGKPAKTLTEE
jgi:hypothetical protein